ncbi:deoxyribodipyrimidine photo-lyase, partial [Escherichia coli]|uniref:deoxyribodipyrimidine photo-lyase n=3 Tax=Enterobacteriaceae TaxID=543 RepID=UPI001952F618
QQRDRQLEKTLAGVVCEGFDDSVMLAPGSVMTGSHEMYKVFTPFKNAFIKRLKEGLPECVTAPAVRGETITDLPEIRLNYPQQSFDETVFPASEKAAIA